jgi:hypothetical protein
VKKELAEIIKEEEVESIRTHVFGVYDPTMYKRRTTGGIDDKANMVAYLDENDDSISLTVRNETPPEDGYYNVVDNLAGLIEYGDNNGYGHYAYTRNKGGQAYGDIDAYLYLEGRPFEEVARENMEQSKVLLNALKYGLKKKKINAE